MGAAIHPPPTLSLCEQGSLEVEDFLPHDVKMFEIIKKAIDEFNLYGFLSAAPSDEFDSESREIAGRITVNSTVEEIAQVIRDVFSETLMKTMKLGIL